MTTVLNEEELLRALARNDRQAAETIYKENYKMVQALILSNNGTADDAQDVFQEAMMVLFERACSDSFELNCQIKTYLYSVSRRLWLKKLSKSGRYTGNVEQVAETVPVEDELELYEQKNLDFQMMEDAMAHLGEPCKSLLEAYYLEKRSMAEIAGNFGYTNADNAKNQKYKCLMRLKKLFFGQYNKTQ